MEKKTIPEDSELIIFDFYNTLLVCSDGNPILRDNAFGLIVRLRLKRKKIAISSTSPLEGILNCPGFLHIKPFVNGIYGTEHVIKEDGQKYKDLGLICRELGVEPEKAVLVGDNYNDVDRKSAERFNVNFIFVPSGENNLEYNLKSLIESEPLEKVPNR